MDRIVITGMGSVNPIGLSVQESWRNALNGISGVAPISLFNPERVPVKIACEVKDFIPQDYMDAKDARRRDRFEQFALAAAKEAISQAGLEINEKSVQRIGVVISAAIGGIITTQDAFTTLATDNARRVSPFAIPMLMPNGAAGMVAIEYGIQGPCMGVVSACASGLDAIGTAWLYLQASIVDAAIAGASEATISEIGIALFDRLGAMSRRNEDYSMTPSPFDLNRDGIVMGEGSAVLVLEREEYARKRGAVILAELAGYAATADAFHITAPSEDGSGGARAIKLALESASISPHDVGYINAHGTATELNDLSETLAVKSAFNTHACEIPISSTKSMTGHMMGATGALETIFCVQAIRTGFLPPTIHYQTPDPRCDLDIIPNQAREKAIEVAVNNAFGFGGHNAVLVLRKYIW